MRLHGAVAEWLGRGLQSLVQQFDSAPRLDRLSQAPARLRKSGASQRSELPREHCAANRNQHGRDSNQTQCDRRRYEKGDDGGHDRKSCDRDEDQGTAVFPHKHGYEWAFIHDRRARSSVNPP